MRAALISIAGQPRAGDGAALAIAGKTAARRQLDFALAAGCERILAVGDGAGAEAIALRHAASLPRTVRLLFRSVGAMQRGGATLLSYLLFERAFCRELIALGYKDAMARQDNLRGFLGYATQWYCELRNSAA